MSGAPPFCFPLLGDLLTPRPLQTKYLRQRCSSRSARVSGHPKGRRRSAPRARRGSHSARSARVSGHPKGRRRSAPRARRGFHDPAAETDRRSPVGALALKEVKVEGLSKLGDEGVYLLRLTPKVGKPSVLHVSARTGLILRRAGDGEVATDRDFRRVDGEVVPYRTTVEEVLGEVSIEVKDVRLAVEFPTGTFGRKTALR
jgi:hypothetical protein